MRNARFELRIPEEEMERWKREAESEGIAVAAWVRKRCGGERRQQAGAAAGSGLPERVTPPKPPDTDLGDRYIREAAAEGNKNLRGILSNGMEDFLPKPSPDICANCEHKKSKHGGFGTCCQQDNCQCPKFE